MAKKKEVTIDGLAVMIANEFDEVRKEMGRDRKMMTDGFTVVSKEFAIVQKEMKDGFTGTDIHLADIRVRLAKIEKDIDWMLEILKSHASILKNSPQDQAIFKKHLNELKEEVVLIKKHLKIV